MAVLSTWHPKCWPSNFFIISDPDILIKWITMRLEFYCMNSCLANRPFTPQKRKTSSFLSWILNPSSLNLPMSPKKSSHWSKVCLPRIPITALDLWKASRRSVLIPGSEDTHMMKKIRYHLSTQLFQLTTWWEWARKKTKKWKMNSSRRKRLWNLIVTFSNRVTSIRSWWRSFKIAV